MTNEQAIYLLKGMRGKAIQSESEALNLAISVLSTSQNLSEPNNELKGFAHLANDSQGFSQGDYISRQDAIDIVNRYDKSHMILKGKPMLGAASIVIELEELPSAQRTGEWIAEEECGDLWICDQCGFASEHNDNYCPNCGADMRGDDG